MAINGLIWCTAGYTSNKSLIASFVLVLDNKTSRIVFKKTISTSNCQLRPDEDDV